MSELTIFYVADIHGSDVCFRKWLNAAGFYGRDAYLEQSPEFRSERTLTEVFEAWRCEVQTAK